MKRNLPDKLCNLLSENSHSIVNKKIRILQQNLKSSGQSSDAAHIDAEFTQILGACTIDRARYYINRLLKSLTEIKLGKLNDLNLNRWKQYNDILTDSLWIIEKRDRSGMHTAEYWGNFIPQIPNQLLRRFTKKGEWVLDPFLGSGTTLIECRKLGRNGVGIELQESITKKTRLRINAEKNPYSVNTKIIQGDSTQLDLAHQLRSLDIPSVQFAILHPPYWDIIKFSRNKNDLSNASSLQKFLTLFGQSVDRIYPVLDSGRILAIVIGDKYSNSEWIPLGFLTMQEAMKKNFLLKSIIVKNFNETKSKRNQEKLWRYRALAGGFYVFKHEYIFLLQKK